MSQINGIYWYVLLASGPACIQAIHNDCYFITDLQGRTPTGDPTFLSPIYKSLAEFKLTYPELFI